MLLSPGKKFHRLSQTFSEYKLINVISVEFETFTVI